MTARWPATMLPLLLSGCVALHPRATATTETQNQSVPTNGQPADSDVIQAELLKFYLWLRRTRQLLSQVMPPGGVPVPRQLDPDTLELLPPPAEPNAEEVRSRLETLLNTPEMQQVLESDNVAV